MANKRFWFVILLLTLVFGIKVVGCEAQSNDGIEGLWNFSDEGIIKFEKGKMLIFDDDGEFEDETSYTIRGNTLNINGEGECKFSIKGNTLTLTFEGESITGTRITESQSPVGRWVPEGRGKAPSGFPDKMEITSDGAGIGDGMGFKWRIENSRIRFDFGAWGAMAYYYIIYGSKLILTNDDDCVTYVKGR